MKIELLVRDYGRMIGLSRYTLSLCEALAGIGVEMRLVTPSYPLPARLSHPLLSRFGLDLKTFLTTYPVQASFSRGAIKHLTAQQMATLLWLDPGLHPALVTVHDIVPHLVRRDKEQDTFRHRFDRYFDRQAMEALKRADALISVSAYTKKTLVEGLGCQADKIAVIPEGVDHRLFRPLPVPQDFLNRYGLDGQLSYVLYVGSDNPRKNLPHLLQAFARVRQALPEARLIKAGTSESPAHASLHQQMVEQLGLEGAVHWLGQVPEEDLPLFYNLARVFAFPSLYEGFGLPPLEAMACGTPVICSNAASLPEVVGEAALLFDPLNVDSIAEAMVKVLSEPALAEDLHRRGLERAQAFTWERAARQTLAVYQQVSSS